MHGFGIDSELFKGPGYWRQECWREAWRPSPRYPGAFNGERQG